MATREERLASLQARRDKINERIQKLAAIQTAESRKAETRRQVLVGVAVLSAIESGEWDRSALVALLDRFYVDERSRAALAPLLGEDYGRDCHNYPVAVD